MRKIAHHLSSLLASISRGPCLRPTRLIDNKFLICWVTLLIILRLWLVEAIDLIATYAPYDEQLFISLAKHILNGQWLGPYDQLTLAKGPGYPIFIALAHLTGIPLLTAEQLLYSAACVLIVVVLRPLFRTQWPLALIFLFLLFNPFMLSYSAMGRVFRLGIYMPLTLCLFGLLLGLLLRGAASLRRRFLWALMVGLCFSYLWYTREEGVWLLPSMILFSLYFMLIYSDLSWAETSKRLSSLAVIAVVFFSTTLVLKELSRSYYGAPVINELKTVEFNSALGGLMNIEGLGSGRFFPVSAASQDAAFSVSPSMALLKPYLYEATHALEYPPAYYIWIFRNAVYQSGHGATLTEALAFYAAIGREIQAACAGGALSCNPRRPSIRPVWKAEYFAFVPGAFWDIWVQALTFSHFTDDQDEYLEWNSTAPAEVAIDYQLITRELLAPGHKHHIRRLPQFYQRMKTEKLRILTDIAVVYQHIVPSLFVFALVAHLVLGGKVLRGRRMGFEIVSGLIVLTGILALITILTYVKSATLTWTINRPLFPVYPLILLYISLMLPLFFRSLAGDQEGYAQMDDYAAWHQS